MSETEQAALLRRMRDDPDLHLEPDERDACTAGAVALENQRDMRQAWKPA